MSQYNWDIRYINLIRGEVRHWSKDPSLKVGAVITRPNNRVVNLGFNGFPAKMEDKPEWYANRDEKLSRIIHAEMNAILNAKQDLEGCTIYTTDGPPCDRCCAHLIQAGITRFVYPEPDAGYMQRWGDSIRRSISFIDDCNLSRVQILRSELNI